MLTPYTWIPHHHFKTQNFSEKKKCQKFRKMSLANKIDNTLLARQTEAVRQMLSFNQVTTVSILYENIWKRKFKILLEGRWKCFVCSVMESAGLWQHWSIHFSSIVQCQRITWNGRNFAHFTPFWTVSLQKIRESLFTFSNLF